MRVCLTLALIVLLAGVTAHPARADDSNRKDSDQAPDPMAFILLEPYRACLSALSKDVDAGRDYARDWLSGGGGLPAGHCLAMGEVMAGAPRTAAIRLADLAGPERPVYPLRAARLYAQAGEILLGSGDLEAAEDMIKLALEAAQTDGTVHLTAGRIAAGGEQWSSTIASIDSAEALGVISTDGLVARGRAYKALSLYEDAVNDIARALRRDPFHLDALVMRGELVQAGHTIDLQFRKKPKDTPPQN